MQIYTGESLARQFCSWGYGCDFVDKVIAPQVVRYDFNLHNILQLQRIKRLCENLSALLRLRVDYTESETSDFSLLVQRNEREIDYLENYADILENSAKYTLPIGTNENGEKITAPLDDLVHILCGGCTNAGKSVILNDFIVSLSLYNPPQELNLILIDAKGTEFNIYNNLPHLLFNVITEVDRAKGALQWLIDEMERRYKILAKLGKVKNEGEFAKIVCIIDELSDILLVDETIKPLLIRLLQKSRACGIHIICGTQSPRAKILDGTTLANLPTRIALTCANVRESVLMLGHKGCEKLNFKGDAILSTPTMREQRIQTPYISRERIQELIN